MGREAETHTVDWESKGEAMTGRMSSQHCWGRGGVQGGGRGRGGEEKEEGWEVLAEGPVPYFRNRVLIK